MRKHRRAKSFTGTSDPWSDSPGFVGTAKEVGKGMFTTAAGMFTTSTPKSRTNLLKSTGLEESQNKYLKPSSKGYPKYNKCISSDLASDIPLLKVLTPTISNAISIEFGPGDGLFECSDSLSERKKFLKNLIKQVQQNPNFIHDENSIFVKYNLGIDEIKEKYNQIKEVEKRLKPTISSSNSQRKDRYLTSDPRISGKTIDTYAFDVIKGEKAGQPNADSYFAEGFPRNICFGLADGIGWGVPSRRASQSALLGFNTFLKAEITKKLQKTLEWDTLMIADICRNALDMSHTFVNSFTEAKTTFVGGMIIELCHQDSTIVHQNKKTNIVIKTSTFNSDCTSSDDDDVDNLDGNFESSDTSSADEKLSKKRKKWCFVGISVGDTLVYRFSSIRGDVKEVTVSDRTFGVRDAGGCIGGSSPDFRNLSYHFCLLDEGDFIIAVSDGVHDNLDPEILKLCPDDLGVEVEGNLWKNIPDTQKNQVKRNFKEHQLKNIIFNCDQHSISTLSIVGNVINFVFDSTADHRNAYERGSELQKNWDKLDPEKRDLEQEQIKSILKNPVGKFDHVTCLCIKVATI